MPRSHTPDQLPKDLLKGGTQESLEHVAFLGGFMAGSNDGFCVMKRNIWLKHFLWYVGRQTYC